MGSKVERSFVAALVRQASDWIAVAPTHDDQTTAALEQCGAVTAETADPDQDDLGRLRRYLFTTEAPTLRTPTGQVTLYSAPGEGREAMEIARYALDEARRGVRFDEMAVLLRSPREYYYTWVAVAMLAGAAVLIALWLAGVISLFWVEIGVAFLFIAFWVAQTIELAAGAMTAGRDQARTGEVAAA